MRITAGFKGPIVAAVVGEVNRLAQHPQFNISEGVAYKVAWDAAGSRFEKHAECFRRDCLMSSLIVTWDRRAALNMARTLAASEGARA